MRLCYANHGDTFVVKFAPGNATPAYSTCMGAPSVGMGIAIDASGNAYVTGNTYYHSYFPITAGAFQFHNEVWPNGTGFVAKLNNTGGLAHSTYLSGSDGVTYPEGIAINRAGEVYVVGQTSSTTFPLAPAITPNPTAGFVAKLTPQLNGLDYVTFLGATILGVAIHQAYSPTRPTYPHVYVGGFRYTGSVSLIAEDAFVSMLDETPTISVCCAAIP